MHFRFLVLTMVALAVVGFISANFAPANADGGTGYTGIGVEFHQPTYLPISSETVFLSHWSIESSYTTTYRIKSWSVPGFEKDALATVGPSGFPEWRPTFPNDYLHGVSFAYPTEEKSLAEFSWNAWRKNCGIGPQFSLTQVDGSVRATVALGTGAQQRAQVLYARPITATVGSWQRLSWEQGGISLLDIEGFERGAFLVTNIAPSHPKEDLGSNDLCATASWDFSQQQSQQRIFLPAMARSFAR